MAKTTLTPVECDQIVALSAVTQECDKLRRIVDWPLTHGVHYDPMTETWWAASDDEYYNAGATFEEAVRRAMAATDAIDDADDFGVQGAAA